MITPAHARYPLPGGTDTASPTACAIAWANAKLAAAMCDDPDVARRERARVAQGIDAAVQAGVCRQAIRRRYAEAEAKANAALRPYSHTINHSDRRDRHYSIPFDAIAETLPSDCGRVTVFLPETWFDLPRTETVLIEDGGPDQDAREVVFTLEHFVVATGMVVYRVSGDTPVDSKAGAELQTIGGAS